MIEETHEQENELPVDQLDTAGEDPVVGSSTLSAVDSAAVSLEVELPFLAPVVEDGYPLSPRPAAVNHFKIRLLAMKHYVCCCTARFQKFNQFNPVRLFVNVPNNNHGFGSFIIAHLDDSECVYSMEYVSCDAENGMQTKVLTPSVARHAVNAEWGSVALGYEDTSQLQRWGQTILDYRLGHDYKNTELFDLLANVPPQR